MKINDEEGTARVEVSDYSRSDDEDVFKIELSDGYEAAGTLCRGNIKVKKCSKHCRNRCDGGGGHDDDNDDCGHDDDDDGSGGGDDDEMAPNPSINLVNQSGSCSGDSVQGTVRIANTTGSGAVEVEWVRITVYWQPGGGDWRIANPQSFSSELTEGTVINKSREESFDYEVDFSAPSEAREYRSIAEVKLVGRDKVFSDTRYFYCR